MLRRHSGPPVSLPTFVETLSHHAQGRSRTAASRSEHRLDEAERSGFLGLEIPI